MGLGRAVWAGIGFIGAFAARADEVTVIPRQPPARERYSAVGLASWYGDELRGRRTADGEIFDSHALTAAHKTLPLPCYARVTNLANGRSVVVRVNDRGPFVGGRIADVSARVASLLEFNHDGVAKIRLDYLGKAPPAGSDAASMSANLQATEAPKAAPPLPIALIEAPFVGLGAIARALVPSASAQNRSPYGDLAASPFVAKTSWP
jgi:rare lipoprotein A